MATKTRAMARLQKRAQEDRKCLQEARATLRRNARMVATLEAIDVEVSADYRYGTLDINVTGDAKRLSQVWRLMRLNGYEPDDRPKGPTPHFATFFTRNQRQDRFFLQFASTVCRAVKVGEKMVPQPVYETRCDGVGLEELPEDCAA